MSRDDIRHMLIDWLDDNYHFGDAEALIGDDDASFLDKGVLDSLGFVALIVHLEDTFSIEIDRKSLNRDNFNTVNMILDFVVTRIEA